MFLDIEEVDGSVYQAELLFEYDEACAGYKVSYRRVDGPEDIIVPSHGPEDVPVTAISHHGFIGNGVVNVTIPSTVRIICENAFDRVQSLRSVLFDKGSGLETVDSFAFSHTSIESIRIPACVKYIGPFAFLGTFSLTEVLLPDDSQLTTIGTSAFMNTRLVHIELPRSVSIIGCQAFKGVRSLQSVGFAKGCQLQEILSGAFEGTSIISIELPPTVLDIGCRAFNECRQLVSVKLQSSVPPWLGFDAFLDTPKLEHIFVPAGSEASYREAEGWSDYASLLSEF